VRGREACSCTCRTTREGNRSSTVRNWAMWILAVTGTTCWIVSELGSRPVKSNDDDSFGPKEVLAVILMAIVCLFVLWLTGGVK